MATATMSEQMTRFVEMRATSHEALNVWLAAEKDYSNFTRAECDALKAEYEEKECAFQAYAKIPAVRAEVMEMFRTTGAGPR